MDVFGPDRLELRHLLHFVAVVDAGSFTSAAHQLDVSQAAVSRNVSALERALGVRLLVRNSRSVRLDPRLAHPHAGPGHARVGR